MNNEKQLTLYSVFFTFLFHCLVFLILFFIKFSAYQPKVEFVELDFENIAVAETKPPIKSIVGDEQKITKSTETNIASNIENKENTILNENDFVPAQKYYDLDIDEPNFGEKQNFNFEEKSFTVSDQVGKPNIDSILKENSSFGSEKSNFIGEISLTDSLNKDVSNISFDESDIAMGKDGVAFKIFGDAGKREVIFKTLPLRTEIKKDGRVEILFQLTPNGNVRNLEPGMKSDMDLYNLVEKYFVKWQFAPTTNSNLEHGKIVFIFKLV